MLKKMGIKSRNIPIIFLTEVIGGMLFFLPILALYFEKSLFSVTNVAIIFAVEAICIALFEIPTGAITDLFGRKKSIILAHIFILAALVFLAIGGSMIVFIVYAILIAFTQSLTSGTYSAFVYDTLKDENKESYYKKVFGTLLAFWPLGASIGSIIGGYLAKISLSLPILITFIPISIAFILTLFLKEPNYEKEEHKNILRHMINSSKIIIHSKQLIVIICAYFIMIALGETTHLLSPLFFKFKDIPIEYFGWIMALIFGFSSFGHYISHDVSEKVGNKKALILATLISPILLLIATLLFGIPLIIVWAAGGILFGIKNPIIDHLINLEVASSKRATVLSINNFMGKIGIAITAPLFGYFAELYTIQTAIQIGAAIVFIVPLILLLLADKK